MEILNRHEVTGEADPFESTCIACASRIKFTLQESRISYSLGHPDTADIDCPACGCEIRIGLTLQQKAIAWRDRNLLKKAWHL